MLHVDQVPIPFDNDCKTTCDVNAEKEDKRDLPVWVPNPGPGLKKHECTQQIWIFPEYKTRIGIIF